MLKLVVVLMLLVLLVRNMSAVTGDLVCRFSLLNRGLILYFCRSVFCDWKDLSYAAFESSTSVCVCVLTSLLVLRRTGIEKYIEGICDVDRVW
jgi:hypothetical protein